MKLGQALAQRSTSQRSGGPSSTLSEYLNQIINWNGLNPFPFMNSPRTTLGAKQEEIRGDFEGYAYQAMKSNPIVFACMEARRSVFSEGSFCFQRMLKGRPGQPFTTGGLAPLQRPWSGVTTSNLKSRMIQDVDLSGNWFGARMGGGIKRLRPDWMTMIIGSFDDPKVGFGDPDAEVLGYIYEPGGKGGSGRSQTFLAHEVAHFWPIPDPVAEFRGMSWITPLIREIMGDQAMTTHKLQFFENGAVPGMVVNMGAKLDPKSFEEWVQKFEEGHSGSLNAFKTIYLAAGAEAEVVGADLKAIEFQAVQGKGEPLALDTPIPTPAGWTTMGEIRPGDEVFGRDGRAIKVLHTAPVHLGRPCFRLTFSDRTSIVADGGHRWRVIDRASGGRKDAEGVRRRQEVTLTTEELIARMAEWDRGGNRYGVPAGAPIDLPDVDLLVDPYVLGAWLGDGQTAGAAICGVEPDLGEIASEIEARGYTVSRWSTAADKADVIGIPGGLLTALNALGVLGNKHIPPAYLRSSVRQRLDLLRGLMDTDGSVGAVGSETCEFSSKLEALAQQVAELARSLGYRATVSCKIEPRSRTGKMWRVTFRANPEMVPFLLKRKAARCQTPVWVKNRAIVSIEPVESVPVRCIAVDAEDHLFRAGKGWTLTHNTRISSAAGVPPIIASLSEGLRAATLANYGNARRHFGDATIRPLWRDACQSLEPIIEVPTGARLWYDASDVSYLQEDEKDAAEIQYKNSEAIKRLVEAGFTPESAVVAVDSGDLSRLDHSGLVSIQLHPPGTTPPAPSSE